MRLGHLAIIGSSLAQQEPLELWLGKKEEVLNRLDINQYLV